MDSSDNINEILRILNAGEMFGDACIFKENYKRQAAVVVSSQEAEIVEFSKKEYLEILKEVNVNLILLNNYVYSNFLILLILNGSAWDPLAKTL